MICPGHYRYIPMDTDPEIGELGDFHMYGRISAVTNVALFAIGAAILNSNDEIFSEQ